MISEMVIRVANTHIESNPSVKLLKILLYVTTTLEDKINHVEITITTLCIISIFQS